MGYCIQYVGGIPVYLGLHNLCKVGDMDNLWLDKLDRLVELSHKLATYTHYQSVEQAQKDLDEVIKISLELKEHFNSTGQIKENVLE